MNKIIITFPQRGSVSVQVIFQSDEFNNLDKNEFINKFKNDENFKDLQNLKEIHLGVVMNACKFNLSQLDPAGNRESGWAVGEKRGNKPYYPPEGWIGIGLKVMDKFDNDNTWIGMDNSPGEWCVAYHGVGRHQTSEKINQITNLIYTGSFKKGAAQAHKNCKNLNKTNTEKKVGEGVFCTPKVGIAEGYAGVIEFKKKI